MGKANKIDRYYEYLSLDLKKSLMKSRGLSLNGDPRYKNNPQFKLINYERVGERLVLAWPGLYTSREYYKETWLIVLAAQERGPLKNLQCLVRNYSLWSWTSDIDAPSPTGISPSSNGLTPSIHAMLNPNSFGLLRR